MPRASKGLLQAYALQDLVFAMAQAMKEELTDPETGKLQVRRDEYGKPVDAPAIAQLVKAWEAAQVRIAFHRRVPSPGSLKPSDREKRSRPRSLAQSILYPDASAPASGAPTEEDS